MKLQFLQKDLDDTNTAMNQIEDNDIGRQDRIKNYEKKFAELIKTNEMLAQEKDQILKQLNVSLRTGQLHILPITKFPLSASRIHVRYSI